MVLLRPHAPGLLLAEHLEGEQAILIFRVANLEAAVTEITEHHGRIGGRFEMPYGVGAQLITPGPQRLAIYEATHAERGAAWRVAATSDSPVRSGLPDYTEIQVTHRASSWANRPPDAMVLCWVNILRIADGKIV